MKWRIGQKIAAGFTVPLLMLAIAGLVSRQTAKQLVATTAAARVNGLVDAIAAEHRNMETEMLLYLATGDERHLRSYQGALQKLQVRLSYLRTVTAEEPTQERAAKQLSDLIGQELAGSRSLAGLRRDQGPRQAERDEQRLTQEMRAKIAAMKAAAAALVQQREAEAAQGAETAVRTVWMSLVFAVVSVLVAGRSITRQMTGSVRNLVRGVEEIRKGALDFRADVTSADELGELTTAFNQMADSLQRAHESLRYSSQLLQLILHSMADGVIVADKTGRLLLFNPAAEQILGFGPTEAPPLDWAARYGLFLSDGRTPCPAEQMPLVRAMHGETARDVELFVRNPRVPGGRWIIVGANPVTDENGRLWGGVAVLTDLTERRRAQQALGESEEKFRSFVETTNEWIWSVDARGILTYSNPAVAEILGYLPSEIIGNEISLFVHPEDRGNFTDWLRKVAANGHGPVSLALRWNHQNRTCRYLESNAVPIVDGGQRVIGYRGVDRDITLRHLAEEQVDKLNDELRRRVNQLNSANQELEAFSYSVSHDLRAPLRSIDGFSHALLEDYEDKLDDDGKDYLQRVRRASQRMAQLIDDLLNLSRVARNEISRRSVDLTELASGIMAELRERQPERQAEIVVAPGLVADADPQLLRIVMENLLGNAWKFTRKEPRARIEVGMVDKGGERVYCVRDNGVGFDMAYADKLFGAFQRLHAMDEFEGTGIGLATIKRIIHRHGGRVWAESAVGQGAAFYFTFS